MAATTTEGTGAGSANKYNPLIVNGKVKDVNVSRNALDMYRGYLNVDGLDLTNPIATIIGDLDITGNIEATGYVRGYLAGQLLNTQFYTFNNGVLTNASGTYTDFASVSYTPVSASSTLLIEYHATFAVNGGQGDGFRSRLTVGATEITWRSQTWADGQGGGTRSGVLFPISMVYTNSSVAAKTIKASANRASGDDTLSLDTTSAYLRVSEYAR